VSHQFESGAEQGDINSSLVLVVDVFHIIVMEVAEANVKMEVGMGFGQRQQVFFHYLF